MNGCSKVQHLLSTALPLPGDESSYKNEQILVALVLASRLEPEDGLNEDDSQLLCAWLLQLVIAASTSSLKYWYLKLIPKIWWLIMSLSWEERDETLEKLLPTVWATDDAAATIRYSTSDPSSQHHPEHSMLQVLSCTLKTTNSLHADWGALLLEHGTLSAASSTVTWGPLLQWFSSQDTTQAARTPWVVPLLGIYCRHAADCQSVLREDKELAASFSKLLLASVVHVSEKDQQLRSTAWTVAVYWLSMEGLNNNNATTASVLLRLAAGEYRIQLEALVEREDPRKLPVLHENGPMQIMIQSCGQVLLTSIQALATIAEEPSLSIPADNLLSLRSSLHDSLHTTTLFLGSVAVACNGYCSLSPGYRHIWGIVIRVLGALLTEWDVFEVTVMSKTVDEEEKGKDRRENDGNEMLRSLMVAMKYCGELQEPGLVLYESILAAIATVLASCEGDDRKCKFLRQTHYGLLGGQNVQQFLLAYFRHFAAYATRHLDKTLDDSLEWAVAILDMHVSEKPFSSRANILSAIIQAIQAVLKIQHNSFTAVSRLITCFVTLQGEEPPKEEHTVVLESAIKTCTG